MIQRCLDVRFDHNLICEENYLFVFFKSDIQESVLQKLDFQEFMLRKIHDGLTSGIPSQTANYYIEACIFGYGLSFYYVDRSYDGYPLADQLNNFYHFLYGAYIEASCIDKNLKFERSTKFVKKMVCHGGVQVKVATMSALGFPMLEPDTERHEFGLETPDLVELVNEIRK